MQLRNAIRKKKEVKSTSTKSTQLKPPRHTPSIIPLHQGVKEKENHACIPYFPFCNYHRHPQTPPFPPPFPPLL